MGLVKVREAKREGVRACAPNWFELQRHDGEEHCVKERRGPEKCASAVSMKTSGNPVGAAFLVVPKKRGATCELAFTLSKVLILP